MCSFLSTDYKRSLKSWAHPNSDIYKVNEIKMSYMDLRPLEDFLLVFKIKCSVMSGNIGSCIYKAIIFRSHLLLGYFVNIQKVTSKWKSSVFSGKYDKVCLAITSILKPWWEKNYALKLKLIESGVVQNPLGTVADFYLFCLTISWSTHSASLFLTSSLKCLTVILPLLFPFSVFIFSCFSFFFSCHLIVRQFLNSPSCGSATGDAQSSSNYVVFLCTTTSSVRFISSALSWPI